MKRIPKTSEVHSMKEVPLDGYELPKSIDVLNLGRFQRGIEDKTLYLRDLKGDLFDGKWVMPFLIRDHLGVAAIKLLPIDPDL